MEFIHSQTIQNFGIAILHSIWQISLMVFIYFYFLLYSRKLSVNHKYTTGLIGFGIILLAFFYTFLSIQARSNTVFPTSTGFLNGIAYDRLPMADLQKMEAFKTNGSPDLFGINFFKVRMLIFQLAGFIGIIWLFGIFLFVIRKLRAYFSLLSLKNNRYNIRSSKWEATLKEISSALNLKKHVDILFSPFLNSPLSFGFLKPVILFPLRLTTGLSNEEIKCILIHELAHNLRNDYLFNIFQNVIEVLFFYHPGIWWMSKKIRTQREIICDRIVLDTKISEKYYANTLLKLSELQLQDANLAIAAKRSNNELFTRIKYIVNKSDYRKKRKGSPFVILAIVLIFIASGFAYKGKENPSKSIILNGGVEKILSPYQGSFVLYDLKQDKYYISSDSLCNTRYPAYSTFKIASSLIALDMGIATDESYQIKYNRSKYPLPDRMKKDDFLKHWFQDHTLRSALYYSVNWYFIELGAQIGNEKMIEYLDKLDYGNKKVTSENEPSWYNGQLEISAVEQVEFIKKILKNDCKNISKEAQNLTKELIPCIMENNYSIYGKTGTGDLTNQRYIGWYVGYLEKDGNDYAFALNIFSSDETKITSKKRVEILKNILIDLGLVNK